MGQIVRRMAAVLAVVALTVGGPWLLWTLARGLKVLPGEWVPGQEVVHLIYLVVLLVAFVCWCVLEVSLVAELVALVLRVPRWLRRIPVVHGLTGGLVVTLAGTGLAAPAVATPAAGPINPADNAPQDQGSRPASPAPGERRHVVADGEDLWTIAETHYGDGLAWRRIFQANDELIDDPNIIRTGWVLKLPGLAPVEPLPTHVVTSPTLVSVERQPDGASIPASPRVSAVVETTPSPSSPAETTPSVVETSGQNEDESPAVPVPHSTATASSTLVTPAPEIVATAAPVDDPYASDPSLAITAIGLAGVVAAGLMVGISVNRRRQLSGVEVGRRPPPIPEMARRVEATLRRQGAPTQLHALRVIQAVVSAHCRNRVLPALERLVLHHDRAELFLSPVSAPPPGWRISPRGWDVAFADLPEAFDEDAPLAFPALATLGARDGALQLVELSELGMLSVTGARAPDVLRGIAASLFTGHGAHATVAAVGLSDVVAALDDPNFHAAPTIAEARALLSPPLMSHRARRLTPDLAEELAPAVLLCAHRASEDERDELIRAAAHRVCVVAIDLPSATWHFDADTGELCAPGADPLTLEPSALARDDAETLTELFAHSVTDETEAAPWWDGTDEVTSPSPAETPVTIATATHPHLVLLGPVDLLGARGSEPPRARRQCVEYAAWLIENPGSTATRMAEELFVAEGTRRSNMSRLRTWLGHDDDGLAYLPEAYSGRITLHPAVSSDWHQLRLLVAGGVRNLDIDDAMKALGLIRGRPLADAAPGQWHWAEPLRCEMLLTVRDLGVYATSLANDARDIDRARWAASQALRVAPDDEALMCARIETELCAGNPSEVERLMGQVIQHARILDVDLAHTTVATLQDAQRRLQHARQMPSTYDRVAQRLDPPRDPEAD